MYAENLTANMGMLKNIIMRGKQKFLSLILLIFIASYFAMPDIAAKNSNRQLIESSGLIAANYFQIA